MYQCQELSDVGNSARGRVSAYDASLTRPIPLFLLNLSSDSLVGEANIQLSSTSPVIQ